MIETKINFEIVFKFVKSCPYPVRIMLAVVLSLFEREELEDGGEQVLALLPAGLLPEVQDKVAGGQVRLKNVDNFTSTNLERETLST